MALNNLQSSQDNNHFGQALLKAHHRGFCALVFTRQILLARTTTTTPRPISGITCTSSKSNDKLWSPLQWFISVPLVLPIQLVMGDSPTCYYPDGSKATNYVYRPCTNDAFSDCCIPEEGDICQPNGLWFWTGGSRLFWGACTDPTWKSPNCPSVYADCKVPGPKSHSIPR